MILTIILFSISGFLNSLMDVIATKWNSSILSNIKNPRIYKWTNPLSWQNKWKNGDYLQGEKFWGSSTIFVWTTDLWHFAKLFMLIILCSSIITYTPFINVWVDALILFLTFTGTFQLFYGKILMKRK